MLHEKHVPFRRWIWFWIALAIPLLSALIVSTIIILSDNAIGQFCGASACWTNFIVFFKVPIAIAGLAIPAVGIAAAIHRSDETAIQIKHSQMQFAEVLANNKFSNYLKHRDSFIDLVASSQSRLLNGQTKVTLDASALYGKVYPNNDYTSLEFYSNSDVQFWGIVRSRLEALLACGKTFDPKTTIRVRFASNLFLQLKQVFDIIEIKLIDGWGLKGVEKYSNIQCYLVSRPDFFSSLSATISLVFDSVEMLNLISSAECNFDDLRSEFDLQWMKTVELASYAAFHEIK